MSASARTASCECPRAAGADAEVRRGAAFIVCMLRASELRKGRLTRLIGSISSDLGRVQLLVPELRRWRAPWQYRVEMGENLVNVAVALEQPLSVSGLVSLKHWTLETESMTRIGGNRTLNLNPGIVLRDRVIVASHKPHGSIREFVGPNCWIQTVALRTPGGQFIGSRTTFSEYAAPSRLALFGCLVRKDLADEVHFERLAWMFLHDDAPNRALHRTAAVCQHEPPPVDAKTLAQPGRRRSCQPPFAHLAV